MATVNPTFKEVTGGVQVVSWVLANGDNGKQVALAAWPDKTVQIIGGTTVSIEGSNDGGVTWAALSTPAGVALTAVVPGIYIIAGNPLAIRPNTAVGTPTVVINAAR